jgi:hypothetical protein
MSVEFITSDEESVVFIKMGFLDAADVDAISFQEILQL